MLLETLPRELSVCKLPSASALPAAPGPWTFAAVTDGEVSLVCPVEDVPACAVAREDGWRGLRVGGALDFALVGILAELARVLAEAGVPIFAVSTYDTDYLLVKSGAFERALDALRSAGHEVAPALTPAR